MLGILIGIVSGCLESLSESYRNALNCIWIFIGMFESYIRNLSGCLEILSGLYRDAWNPLSGSYRSASNLFGFLLGCLKFMLEIYRDSLKNKALDLLGWSSWISWDLRCIHMSFMCIHMSRYGLTA